MHIREAELSDISTIMQIYDYGREQMRAEGNTVQWVNGYPSLALVNDDIANRYLFVVEDGGEVHAVFAYIAGTDPTYNVIEGGQWLNDKPYAAIHRVSSDGAVRGVMHSVVEFGRSKGLDLRIDTHETNTAMRAAVSKEGFVECGIITIGDGTKRVAYHLAL